MERLNNNEVVIGDGGFVFALEKRGYVKAGPWTPEAVLEEPEAGKRLIFLTIIPHTKYTKRTWGWLVHISQGCTLASSIKLIAHKKNQESEVQSRKTT